MEIKDKEEVTDKGEVKDNKDERDEEDTNEKDSTIPSLPGDVGMNELLAFANDHGEGDIMEITGITTSVEIGDNTTQ